MAFVVSAIICSSVLIGFSDMSVGSGRRGRAPTPVWCIKSDKSRRFCLRSVISAGQSKGIDELASPCQVSRLHLRFGLGCCLDDMHFVFKEKRYLLREHWIEYMCGTYIPATARLARLCNLATCSRTICRFCLKTSGEFGSERD